VGHKVPKYGNTVQITNYVAVTSHLYFVTIALLSTATRHLHSSVVCFIYTDYCCNLCSASGVKYFSAACITYCLLLTLCRNFSRIWRHHVSLVSISKNNINNKHELCYLSAVQGLTAHSTQSRSFRRRELSASTSNCYSDLYNIYGP